ncbi:hypothetical protein VCX68_10490 [Aeromonas caviae]|uniref:hypothetical protein n=1 Tax=Aeromonas caviae TaxID=648 RepID=UPI002B2441EF|nr:hypothetical protein [Aeromonas caviae]MEA9426948.1 hypothetical protein [Aeromonas caviae]
MKKTLIALAVAGLSFNAMAINFTEAKPEDTTSKYPKELAITAGTVLADTAAETVIVKAGVSLTTPYVRFELANAKFEEVPTLATSENNPGPATVAWVLTAGGKGENYAVFNKKLVGGGTANSNIGEVLTLSATGGLKLDAAGKVDVAYSIHETAQGAINKTGALLTKSGTQLEFVDSLEVSAKAATGLKEIDLAPTTASEKGKVFTDNATKLTTPFIDLSVDKVAGLKKRNGTAAALTDLIASGTWTLTGDFSARSAAGVGGSTFVTTDSKAVLAAAAPVDLSANTTYNVAGTKLINGGVYSAELTVVPMAGYVFGSYKTANAAEIKKNGSSTEIDLALNPVGAYDNFIRVTNKGNAAGEVTFNVINDQGDVKQTSLASVLGADKGLLAAGASTTQINIKDIADKAGFTAVDGKLRLVIDTTIPRADKEDMVVAQSYAANKTNGVLTLLK